MLHNWPAISAAAPKDSDDYILIQEDSGLYAKKSGIEAAGYKITNNSAVACGQNGCVYLECTIDDKECGILKIGSIKDSEILFSMRAGKKGFGPKIFSTFETPLYIIDSKNTFAPYFEDGNRAKTAVIVMERFDFSLMEHVENPGRYAKIDGKLLAEKLRTIFQAQFDNGFIHGDLHAGNIVYRQTSADDFKIALIDFGYSYVQTRDTPSAQLNVCFDWLSIGSHSIVHEYTESVLNQLESIDDDGSIFALWKEILSKYQTIFSEVSWPTFVPAGNKIKE